MLMLLMKLMKGFIIIKRFRSISSNLKIAGGMIPSGTIFMIRQSKNA
jgi:hypothetical protein